MNIYLIISIVVLLSYGSLLWWFRRGIGNLNEKTSNTDKPSISVIVALKNEEKNVRSMVRSLNEIDYPDGLLEIILVNDHSTDATQERLNAFQSNAIQVYLNEGKGKKSAILTGVKKAKGDWIAVTDADCKVPQLWLKSLTKSITRQIKMVLGPVFIQNESKGFLEIFQQIEFLGLQGATAGSAGVEHPISANGANMLFHKVTFNEIQPYEDNIDLNTGDDQFLMMKMVSEKGAEAVTYCWEQNASVLTNAVPTWSKYFTQRIRWASKGTAYKDLTIVSIGALVILSSLWVGISIVFGLSSGDYLLSLGVLGGKLLIDLIIIKPTLKLAQGKVSFFQYLFSGIFYPFVVVVSALAGIFRRI